MNSRSLRIALALLGCILLLAQCKKKKEDETLPYLDGTLTFELDRYLAINTKVSLTPSGLVTPEGKEIVYTWKVSPVMTTGEASKAEDGGYSYEFGDSLGTYTVSCVASCKDYYSSTSTRYVTLVDSSKSIIGIEEKGSDEDFVDGEIPFTGTTIGSLVWMKSNSWRNGNGRSFYDYAVLDRIFGRFYTWNEAMATDSEGKSIVCPDGWHIPTDKEWAESFSTYSKEPLKEHEDWDGMAAYLIAPDAAFNEERMWEYWPVMEIKAERSGFSAIPFGYSNNLRGEWKGVYERAVFWTADASGEEHALFREVVEDKGTVFVGRADRDSFGASVRCVKSL